VLEAKDKESARTPIDGSQPHSALLMDLALGSIHFIEVFISAYCRRVAIDTWEPLCPHRITARAVSATRCVKR
jgi:hypothetical protein